MKPVKYGEEHKGYDDHEKDSSENCKYCRIQAVFANSSILEHLSHEKGCKRDIKDNIRPALKDINRNKKCHFCDRMFSFKKSLDRHIEAVHGGKKPFKCKICDQCFPQINGLCDHVKLVQDVIDLITIKDFEHPLVKSESTEMKTEVKIEVKVEPFKKFESREQDGIDLITRKDFDYPSIKSELTEMKTEVKNEVKEEPFEDFESCEQMGIDFITSEEFHHTSEELEIEDHTSYSKFDMSICTVQKYTKNKAFKNESMFVINEKPTILSGDEQVIEIPSRAVEDPYKCSKCPDSFESIAKVSKHIKTVHSISEESDDTEKSEKLDLPMSPKVAKRCKDLHLT